MPKVTEPGSSEVGMNHQSPCHFRGPEMGGKYRVGEGGRAGGDSNALGNPGAMRRVVYQSLW